MHRRYFVKMPQCALLLFVLVTLVVCVSCGGGDGEDEEHGNNDGNGTSSGSGALAGCYSLTIVGSVEGGSFQCPQAPPFRRLPSRLLVRNTVAGNTANGVNPIEVFLQCGNPSIFEQHGALQFTTNLALLPGSALQGDLAIVAFNPGALTVQVQPDPTVRGSELNQFASTAGLIPNNFKIENGSIQITFENNGNTVSGAVDIAGTGITNGLNVRRYTAQFSGRAGGEFCP